MNELDKDGLKNFCMTFRLDPYVGITLVILGFFGEESGRFPEVLIDCRGALFVSFGVSLCLLYLFLFPFVCVVV